MEDTRHAIVAWAKWLEAHKQHAVYTEGAERMDNIGRRGELPLTSDCSAFVTVCYNWAGADDPNGLSYNHEGYTGTLVSRGVQIELKLVEPGDVVIYGAGNGVHTAVIVEGGPDPLTISMGEQGDPSYVRVSSGNPSPDRVVRYFRYHTGARRAFWPVGSNPVPAAAATKGTTVNLNLTQLENLLRKVASYGVVINDFTNSVHLPPNVKMTLTAAAGLLLTVDHYVAKK